MKIDCTVQSLKEFLTRRGGGVGIHRRNIILSKTLPCAVHVHTFPLSSVHTTMSSTQNITSALVIGGTGNLGHNVVKKLLKLDPPPKVSVFDLNTSQNRAAGVEYYDVDITNKTQVDSALSKTRPQVI